jgi:hypothetical protein
MAQEMHVKKSQDPYHRCDRVLGSGRFESFGGRLVEVEYVRYDDFLEELVFLKDHRSRYAWVERVHGLGDLDLYPDIIIRGDARFERTKEKEEYGTTELHHLASKTVGHGPHIWCSKRHPVSIL